MADIITNLHPDGDNNTNLYPNIKKENIPSKSISTDKLDDNVLSLIGSLKPSGTDTSTNILAYTYNKGIYVATDNGHWYYWNGSKYADGGVFQSRGIADGSIIRDKLDDDLKEKTDLVPQLSESITEIENNKISKPTIADNNKFPRAKNGNVEWVEQGLPTDEQTENAVTKWLDKHPEATTTVQDGSLSDVKFSASGLLAHIPVVATVAELQKAITDGRKTIALLTGATFNVNSKIVLGNDVTLFGCGAKFVRTTGFEGMMISCGTGCKLQDFSMDGNRTAMIIPTWDKTIEIATGSNCVVNNIKIDNGNEAIVAYGDDVEIINCKITNCGGNGIHFSGGNRTRVENCTVINTNLKSGMGHEDGCIIWSDSCNETTCIGNYVENGLYGFGAIDTDHNSRIIIANNIMKNMRTGAFEGIFLTSIPDKIMILDNMIINCKVLAINRTDANKAVDKSFVISGNLITSTFMKLRRINNIQYTNNILINAEVEVVSCNFAKITNNKFIGKSAGNKISVYSSVGCEISNNTIHNYSITGYGITIQTDSTHCVISNNVIVQMPYIGSVGTPVAISTGNGAVVCNNVIYGYSGVGISVANGSMVQSNAIYGKDSSFIPIRVFGGVSGVIISCNSYIGTNSISTPSNSIVQNNLENTQSPWVPLTANFTNVTGNQFGSILKCDTYSFAITADEGYTLPSEIAVTGAESYEYNTTTGVITIYQPTSAVTVTAEGVAN